MSDTKGQSCYLEDLVVRLFDTKGKSYGKSGCLVQCCCLKDGQFNLSEEKSNLAVSRTWQVTPDYQIQLAFLLSLKFAEALNTIDWTHKVVSQKL